MTKRTKNAGSVVERKRKDGTVAYMLKWSTYTRTAPPGTTRGEALKLLPAFVAEAQSGQIDAHKAVVKERIAQPTLEQWADIFLAEHVAQDPDRASTRVAYRQALRLYILPALGAYKLHEIEEYMVRQTMQALNKRGLAIATIRLTYAVLRRAFDAAIEDKVLKGASPMPKFSKLRLGDKGGPAKTVKDKVLTHAQIPALLAECKAPDLKLFVSVMASCGLRPGEALGLRWSDIDLAAGKLHVKSAVKVVREDGETRRWIGKPKTKFSVREMPIGAFLVARLKEELERQEDYQRQLLGHGEGVQRIRSLIKGDCCVFPVDPDTAEGQRMPVDPHNMYGRFSRAAERAGLKTSPHALRHTHISHALAGGLTLAEAKERAGHGSVLTTANTYVHVVTDSQHKAAAIGDDLITPAAEQLPNVTQLHK